MAKAVTKRPRAANPLKLRLPATSANLGPAFDAAGLALGMYLTIEARPAKEFAIIASGLDAEICGRVENHLTLNTYREVLKAEGKPVQPLALKINNEIPLGKGCGSSAAARLAGIVLAVHFGKLRWSDRRIVGEASRREHHPDNAAACWLGGLTVARQISENEAQVAIIQPKQKWPLLVAIPPEPLSTEEARGVLPGQYSRVDAVANIQNSMLLLAALTQGKPDMLASSLHDRLHEPYRAPLCPLLPALQELSGESGVLGAVLSGAGPSVLIFLDPKAGATRSKAIVERHLLRKGLYAELVLTRIMPTGAAQSGNWQRNNRTIRRSS
ncbi:MAG TPA: homoserine kinase [Terriglobales bacterium]|nr:homoserine kinase [Terriglobales bacterium]